MKSFISKTDLNAKRTSPLLPQRRGPFLICNFAYFAANFCMQKMQIRKGSLYVYSSVLILHLFSLAGSQCFCTAANSDGNVSSFCLQSVQIDLNYIWFNAEQEEITMRSAKLRKCANRSPGSVWDGTLGRAPWNAYCPSAFCTRFLFYHNTLNHVISIHLFEIFFLFSQAGIICFLHSRPARIHRKWPVHFLWCFVEQGSKQLSITCFLTC